MPKQFFLGFASSLGITKDITRTQAYSVWLQGEHIITPFASMYHSGTYLGYYAACRLLLGWKLTHKL